MTLEFYEGGAGTGKTHCLVTRATDLVDAGMLGERGQILALTYMNGARQRLQSRLGERPSIRRRLLCQTFDVFARYLSGRRRSLLSTSVIEEAAKLDAFSAPCFLAARLLQVPIVQAWVARSFPLIVIDEAQDLDEHRLGILKGLESRAYVIAAADGFQCLAEGRDTGALMKWLLERGTTHHLTHCRRTAQAGLIGVATDIRGNADVLSNLNRNRQRRGDQWEGAGIRILDVPAKNAGIVGWAIAFELRRRKGSTVILTPDSRSPLVLGALEEVRTRKWNSGIGPFPFDWEVADADAANNLIAACRMPERATVSAYRAALGRVIQHPAVETVLGRMDRTRRVTGRSEFTRQQVVGLIHECVRDHSRFRGRPQFGRLAMTIHRAKNREFQNVVVLWPHSVSGDSEHSRRLLYNAVTRAMGYCSIIVIGQGRLTSPPFVPSRPVEATPA